MENINLIFKIAGAFCVASSVALYLLLYIAMSTTANKGIGSLNGKLRSTSVRKEKG